MFLNCKSMDIEDTSLDPSSHVQKVYNATFFGSQKCGWKSFHENELLSLQWKSFDNVKWSALVGYVMTIISCSLGQWEKDRSLYCLEWCFRCNSKCYVGRGWFGTFVTHQYATHLTLFTSDSVWGSFGALWCHFYSWHCQYDSLWLYVWVKIFKQKMTISH